jgi:hypothetical protein
MVWGRSLSLRRSDISIAEAKSSDTRPGAATDKGTKWSVLTRSTAPRSGDDGT